MLGVVERVKGWLFEDGEEAQGPVEAAPSTPRRRKSSLLSLHNPRGEEIFIRRPHSREEAPMCADCLRARCPVIVNLKDLDDDTAKRVFDFLAGVVYAIEGQMEEVGEGIFLLTPREVDITTAELDGEDRPQPQDGPFWQEA